MTIAILACARVFLSFFRNFIRTSYITSQKKSVFLAIQFHPDLCEKFTSKLQHGWQRIFSEFAGSSEAGVTSGLQYCLRVRTKQKNPAWKMCNWKRLPWPLASRSKLFSVAFYVQELLKCTGKIQSAISKNRELKKMKFSFFPLKTCIVKFWHLCSYIPIEWLTFCQNWLTCYYFLLKKLNFHFFLIPLFLGIATQSVLRCDCKAIRDVVDCQEFDALKLRTAAWDRFTNSRT